MPAVPEPARARPPAEGVPKGRATRERIVGRALELAGQRGLDGVTIGDLATDLKLSKSGLYAHFKSKERLQLDVLDAAAADFSARVFVPALREPRGLPRLEAIFERWLAWLRVNASKNGCIFIAGAMEWDDREGVIRDALVHWFEELRQGLGKSIRLAIEAGHLRSDIDADQLASDLHSIALKYHLDQRLMHSPRALPRARTAFQRLIDAARPSPAKTRR